MPKLVTDWVKVAESGKTIDGRNIEPEWLRDAAELYSKQTYTAVITLEHWDPLWAGSYGTVEDLEYREENDVVSLYAKLCPNDQLVQVNRSGQKLFTSIKFTPNFRDSGKMYVSQIGVTDTPASIGTEQLAFRAGTDTLCQGEELPVFEFDDQSVLNKIKQLFSTSLDNPNTDTEKDDPMTPEQIKALQDGIVAGLGEAFNTSFATLAETLKPKEEAQPEKEEENGETVSLEAFNTQKTELDALKTQFSALEEKLKQPVPPTQIDNPGSDNDAGCDL